MSRDDEFSVRDAMRTGIATAADLVDMCADGEKALGRSRRREERALRAAATVLRVKANGGFSEAILDKLARLTTVQH